MAETRKSRRVVNALLAKQRYDETKTARARNAYIRKQGLVELGSRATSEHYEMGRPGREKGSEGQLLLIKRAADAKKKIEQARKSTGPRKLNGE